MQCGYWLKIYDNNSVVAVMRILLKINVSLNRCQWKLWNKTLAAYFFHDGRGIINVLKYTDLGKCHSIVSQGNLHETYRAHQFTSLWPPCIADADIIFFSCGFYLLSSFSSPVLSGCRLDVYT